MWTTVSINLYMSVLALFGRTIKEVSFHYKFATEDQLLSDLSVTRVDLKAYFNAEKPAWAVEKPGLEWNLSVIRPLWGIINSNRLNDSDGLRKVQSEHLYLPASSPVGPWLSRDMVYDLMANSDSMVRAFQSKPTWWISSYTCQAATYAPGLVMDYIYHKPIPFNIDTFDQSHDGSNDRRVLAKWRKLATFP